MSEVKEDLLDFEFTIPEFFDKDKFKINSGLIENKMTKDYIASSDKLEYIFKVVLGSFGKNRKKPIGVFTDGTVRLFNLFVDRISNHIESYMNKMSEMELTRAGLLDFEDFFSIKYDVDADGEVYPDVYSEITGGSSEKDKKKGMKGKTPPSNTSEKPTL
jgi:hypothetical protein